MVFTLNVHWNNDCSWSMNVEEYPDISVDNAPSYTEAKEDIEDLLIDRLHQLGLQNDDVSFRIELDHIRR